MKQRRLPEQGGHMVERAFKGGSRSLWRCTVCKARSGSRVELQSQRCKGDPRARWAEEAVDPRRAAVAGKKARLELDECLTDGEDGELAATQPHIPVWSGDLILLHDVRCVC